jgi:hypothetical protein
MKQKESMQSYHPYYLFVIHDHLEFGLCTLEVHPVYGRSFQLKNLACSKTGGSGITVVTEIH